MKNQQLFFYSMVVCFCVGASCIAVLVYAIHTNIFIIRWSSAVVPKSVQSPDVVKKKVKLYFYKRRQLRHEEKELLWSFDNQKSLGYLIVSWLTILFEEEIVKKRVMLQSVVIANAQAYISFDRSFLSKEKSVYEKLLIIQGLLKTIQEHGIVIQKIQFLVHHQPLHDNHLDFSKPWPVSGYI